MEAYHPLCLQIKLVRKQEAAVRKIATEQALQQRKAAREAQPILDIEWNAEYRKGPKKPIKPPWLKVVLNIGGTDSIEYAAGIENVEGITVGIEDIQGEMQRL